jgi:O-antigen biosynthesis protein
LSAPEKSKPSRDERLPPCQWETFEADWYAATYMRRLGPGEPSDPLAHYTRVGARRGASPNRYFDESWYLARYAAVRDAVQRGEFASGFAHYCAAGYITHDPHWLFNQTLYTARHPDAAAARLSKLRLRNAYQHYLAVGQNQTVSGSYFFDPQMFVDATGIAEQPYATLLGAPWLGNLRLSPYFDPDWYLAAHPEVEDEIAEGWYGNALHHFLANQRPTSFAGSADFDEAFYAARYPDVGLAIAEGVLRTGLQHFVDHGRFEDRQPAPWFDPLVYRRNQPVSAALERAPELTAFDHYIQTGRKLGLPATRSPYAVPLAERPGQEAAGKDIFSRFAHLWATGAITAPLRLAQPETPDVSVVICAFNQFDLTMQTLLSLSGNTGASFETILIDNASVDGVRQIEQLVDGLRLIRNESNIGFLRASNQGIAAARGRYVLLLNNDVYLPPNALARAVKRMDGDESIGALGGKVVRTHGQLQEAGCVLFSDGSSAGYGRDRDPFEPEFDFPRDVDFVSGLFLMLPRKLLLDLGGLDAAFAPAYYEDTDLCVRVWKSGRRVVYDPTVAIVHLEYGSARNPNAPVTLMRRHREIFLARHRDFLLAKQPPSAARIVLGRSTARRRRVLVIEDTIPYRHLGSGFVRANDVVASLSALGCEVTVFPMNPVQLPANPRAGFDEGVELLWDRCIEDVAEFLRERAEYYDLVWVCRAHNLDRISGVIDANGWGPIGRARTVLDTEALACNREAIQAAIEGRRFDVGRALRRELRHAHLVQDVVSVSTAEAAQLKGAGMPRVHVLGHAVAAEPYDTQFAKRADILALGALYGADTPNVDGLRWFVAAVWPLVRRKLKTAKLHIAGFVAPGFEPGGMFDGPGVIFHGPVADPTALYANSRLFLAPTRFAAGIPFKVHEAASHGLPAMATALIAEQLGWTAGEDIAAAPAEDAAGFAAALVAAYSDEALWTRLRAASLARVAAECDPEAFRRTVQSVLGVAARPQARD